MPRHVMTARRRVALRKAQLVSARKRRGKRMSPETKRKLKKAGIISAGVVAAVLVGREIKVTNTYMYAMARYRTGLSYRNSPNKEYERRHMKHRQREAMFGGGRSTFKRRRKRQAYQRNITRNRIRKLGFPTYAYRMTRNHTRYDPYVDHALTKLGKTPIGLKVKQTYPVKQIKQANFARSVRKTIKDL